MKKKLLLSIIISITAILLLVTCQSNTSQSTNNEEPIHEIYEEIPIELQYGLPVDSFLITEDLIKRNQNLSHILAPLGVSAKTIDQIARNNELFDVRQMRSGNTYKLFMAKDSLASPEYFSY